MKNNLVLTLCLSLIFVLAGCNSDKKTNGSIQVTNQNQTLEDSSKNSNNSKQAANEKNTVAEKKETASNNATSTQSTKIDTNEQIEKDKNNVSKKVNSKVKLYNGTYFDDKCFGEHILKNYCEVVISNVTNTSFDFTIYEVNVSDGKKENKKVIFLKNTAIFTGDGTKATFYGNNYTLNFTFPNYHHAYPVVTDMEISGLKPLEGNTYVNNGIPGHEFG